MSTVRSQGRRSLLMVGIALSLAMPAPAWAGQPGESTNGWKTESAAAPAADDDTVVLDDSPGPVKKNRGSGKKKDKTKAQPREAMIKAQVEKAEAERAPLQDQAQQLSDAGNLEGAVGLLAGGAEALRDPVLHLAAADARQKLARKRSADQAKAEWEASLRHIDRADALLAANSGGAVDGLRVNPDDLETMHAWSTELRTAADSALPDLVRRTNPVRRNARGELIAGSIFLAGGLAALGVMGGGIYLSKSADRELPKADGNPEYLAPLEAQKKQGDTMTAAGAVAGVLGVALGVTLVALGATDLKKARQEQLSRVRVAPAVSPTFGGMFLSARF
ncbi:hypothetical protein OV203_34540 [Nannocystis sp. ILAH1]|uniref:hypothetical protein n=1 Tax=unclassified Nannocystis TaxID=2627009 RepID=UPI002271D9DF|nr:MULTISPECIES: hypothetical protein [unclassified Nannocystis]MCY0992308.1 hypothetical protein [Nannocystis sp. ILAH1]MCY1069104.1 hypothetical protein [Nannocystis sp. RBIL2]